MRHLLLLGLVASTSVLAQDITLGSTLMAATPGSGGTSLGYIDQPTASNTLLGYGPNQPGQPGQPGQPNGPVWPLSPTLPIAPLAPLTQLPQLPAVAADPLNPQLPADPQSPLAVHLLVQSNQSSGATATTESAMPPAQKAAGTLSVKTFDSLQNVASNVTNLVKVVTTVSSGQ